MRDCVIEEVRSDLPGVDNAPRGSALGGDSLESRRVSDGSGPGDYLKSPSSRAQIWSGPVKCCTWPPTLLSFLAPSYSCLTIGAPDFYVVSPVTSNPSCRHERGNSGLSSAGHFSSLSGPDDLPAARITIIPPSAPRWPRWKRTRSLYKYSGMKRRLYQHTLLCVPLRGTCSQPSDNH